MRRRAAGFLLLGAAGAMVFWAVAQGTPSPVPADILPGPRPLPERALRLTAFGTSLTRNGLWPDAVAAGLSACLARQVTVARVAAAGANSDWGRAQAMAAAATAPDLILIEFAINDADLRDGIGPGRAGGNLRHILAVLRAARPDAQPVLASTNPARGLRGLVRPLLGRHYAATRRVAAEEGAGFFDGAARWGKALRPGDLPDGLHPTAGAEARVLVPALTRYLGAIYGRDCR